MFDTYWNKRNLYCVYCIMVICIFFIASWCQIDNLVNKDCLYFVAFHLTVYFTTWIWCQYLTPSFANRFINLIMVFTFVVNWTLQFINKGKVLKLCFTLSKWCLYTYEFWLSLCKIVRSSVILLLLLFNIILILIFIHFLNLNLYTFSSSQSIHFLNLCTFLILFFIHFLKLNLYTFS